MGAAFHRMQPYDGGGHVRAAETVIASHPRLFAIGLRYPNSPKRMHIRLTSMLLINKSVFSSLFHKAIYMPFVCVVCRFVVWFVQFCFIKRKVHFYVTNYNYTTYIYKYHESRPNSFHVFHKGQLIAPNYIPSAEM